MAPDAFDGLVAQLQAGEMDLVAFLTAIDSRVAGSHRAAAAGAC